MNEDQFQNIDDNNGVDEFRQYLAKGGDINQSRQDSGWSLMHIACELQNELLIRALFMADNDILNTRATCDCPPITEANY